MPDFRTMFDSEWLGAWDLVDEDGRHIDCHFTIARVEPRKVKGPRGESLKPVVWFNGVEKALLANKTNARTIAAMYGTKTEAWIGKRISLWATKTNSPDGEVECIRIRPTAPPEAQPKANGGKSLRIRLPGEEG